MSDANPVVTSAKQRLEILKASFKNKSIDEAEFKLSKTALLKEMEKARHAERKAALKAATEERTQEDVETEPPAKRAKTTKSSSEGGQPEKKVKDKSAKEPKIATKSAEKAEPTKAITPTPAPAKTEITSLSLHVSQLAFDTSKLKLREYFAAHNCTVAEGNTGVRLCYAKNGDPTGVAFVDMVDLKSVKLGLKLHRSRFGGRLINVRPTRTEAELLEIVAKRNEGLQAQGLAYKATSGEKPAVAPNLAKRPLSSNGTDAGPQDAIEKSKRKAKKDAAKLKRALPKDIARPNVDALAAREKWSESKKKRERANQKKRRAKEQAAAEN